MHSDLELSDMDSDKGILQQIRQAAAIKLLFLPRAVQQMSRV
jgi:hypothetical protein